MAAFSSLQSPTRVLVEHSRAHRAQRQPRGPQLHFRPLGQRTAPPCGSPASGAPTRRSNVAPGPACRPHTPSWVCQSSAADRLSSSSRAQPPPAAHPQALFPLYEMYFFACFVERTWRFGLPLVLAHIQGGFQAIAILGFASPLASMLLVPSLGRVLDCTWRPYGLGAMVALQDVSILASCVVLILAAARPAAAAVPLVDSKLFVALVLLSMVERLSSAVSEMLIERDWVPQIAGKHNMAALSNSNAILKRTDLGCELVGALLFGWAFSWGGVVPAAAFLSVVALLALPLQVHAIYKIAKLAPGAMVHGRQDASQALFKPQWKRLLPHPAPPSGSPAAQRQEEAAVARQRLWPLLKEKLSHSLDGWLCYFKQPILPSSLAYVLLFLNVVLSPHGLITAFLTSWGFDGRASAVFRGGCATCGFLGTALGKHMIQTVGLLKAGQNALLIKVSLLTAATLIYFTYLTGPPELGVGGGLLGGAGMASVAGIPLPVVAFAALVVMSRVGMWCMEMVNAQLFQAAVPQREMSSASSAEMALCSFAELFMLGIAAISVDATAFGKLVIASLAAVAAAATVFTVWARRAEQDVDGPVQSAMAMAA